MPQQPTDKNQETSDDKNEKTLTQKRESDKRQRSDSNHGHRFPQYKKSNTGNWNELEQQNSTTSDCRNVTHEIGFIDEVFFEYCTDNVFGCGSNLEYV